MAVEHSPFREFDVTIGSDTLRVWGFQDATGDWVSLDQFSILTGWNIAGASTGFLRTLNGIVTTATFGPVVAHDSKIISITASSLVLPTKTTHDLRLHSAGSQIWSTSWKTLKEAWGVDLDIADNTNISADLLIPLGVGNPASRPIVQIQYRWRFD